MMMWDLLSTVMTSVLGGGATGLLGMVIQRFFDMRKEAQSIQITKMQLDAAKEARTQDLEFQERMAGKAADLAALQAQLDAQARETESADQNYRASMDADKATFTAPLPPAAGGGAGKAPAILVWVDALRGSIRPGATIYTLILLTMVFLWVQDLYSQAGLKMSPEQVHQLAMQCVGTVFYLSTTCMVWWFGVRPSHPPAGRPG